ncbi:hypothetical protein Clacol_009737 [Clathrus columnatus]|uniref:Endo-1,5-alpha-L-arabinanase A n=1 Tax=Clathrus columnatus TaxID=1419009 RepID=A0AAV5ART2_9AGAM|nr:hypothetical protein Clacol_009737 [Clathrus columnatus]
MKSLFYLLATPLLALAQNWPPPANVTGDTAVHDPSICLDKDGKYWLFTTSVDLQIITSEDRKAWTSIGTMWAPGEAVWTNKYAINGSLWAPDCHYINNEFWVYYAASTIGSRNSAIFLARSKTGLPGNWTNEGLVTSTSPTDNYNAIDPKFPLLPNDGSIANSSLTSLAMRNVNNGAIEGSYLFQVGSYYYLFSSWDVCCAGVNSTYNVRVARSTSPSGPFVDQDGVNALNGGGTLILGTHGSIIAPGGESVFMDKNDTVTLVYHYVTPNGSFLGLNGLNFSTGWPVVTALE